MRIGVQQELCEKIATYYNEMYRTDKSSKYTWKNVCVVPGGRAGITRIMASLTEGEIGYTVPDYTACENLMLGHSHAKTQNTTECEVPYAVSLACIFLIRNILWG